MARIKTLKGDNLLGTYDSANEFIYPVTIYDAVYDTDNKSLAETLPYRTIRDISNEFKEANEDILDISLEDFLDIEKTNLSDKVTSVPGFIGKFYSKGQYYLYIFNSSDISGWRNKDNWVSILLDRDITNDLGDSENLVVSQRLLDIVNKNIGLDKYKEYSTGKPYSKGTSVIYNNELYIIISSITAENNTEWSKVKKERTSLRSLIEESIDNLVKNYIITITDLEDPSGVAINNRKILYQELQSSLSTFEKVVHVVDNVNNIWYSCTFNIDKNPPYKLNLCLSDNYTIHTDSDGTDKYTTRNIKIYTLDVEGNCSNTTTTIYNNRVRNSMIPDNEISVSKINNEELLDLVKENIVLNAEDIFDLPESSGAESTITSEKNKQAFELLSTHLKSGKNIVINYENHFLYLQRTEEEEFLSMWFSNTMNITEYSTAFQDFASCNSINLILNSEGLLSLYENSLNVVFDVTLPYDYIIGNDHDKDLNKSFYNRLCYLNVISSGSGCNVRLYNAGAHFNADSIFFIKGDVTILFHNIVGHHYEDLYVTITKDGIMSYEIYDSNPLDEVIIRRYYLPEKEEAIRILSLIGSSLFNNGHKRIYTPVFITDDERKLYPLQISYTYNDNSTKLEMLFRGDKEDFIVTIDSEGNFNIDYKELDVFNKEGDYPLMSVGVAENLVGRGEAVDTMFSYRSSGGVKPSGTKRSIETGDARITSIKGNSVVMNQLWGSTNQFVKMIRIESTTLDGITTWTATGATAKVTSWGQNVVQQGHSYILSFEGKVNGTFKFGNYDGGVETDIHTFVDSRGVDASMTEYTCRIVAGFTGAIGGILKSEGDTWVVKDDSMKVIDLTQMFGAGNEPTTVEEYYARIGELPDEYDAGTLRDMQVSAIETTGFNQWDEVWEVGSLNSLGGNAPATNTIRSTNFIKVLPNTKYYLKSNATDNILVYAYDAKKQFVERIAVAKNTIITTNDNNFYIRFRMGDAYGSTYNHDICINLSHSGYKNGEYRPYELFRRAMPDLSKYFEGGVMRRAGNVCDEFRYNPTTQQWEAIQRVGVVDLGSLDWKWFDAFKSFTTISMANSLVYRSPLNVPNIFTTFATSASYGVFSTGDESRQIDKTMSINQGGTLMIRDRTYTDNDPVAFKAALQGVMLNYELSEPIVKPVTENLNLVYDVNDFGTERAIQPENSAPFRADVVYGFNAIDTIRTNAEAIEQLFARVAALENKTATTNQ